MTELDTNIFRAVSSLYFSENGSFELWCEQEDIFNKNDYSDFKIIVINRHYGINTIKIDDRYAVRLMKISMSDDKYRWLIVHSVLAYLPILNDSRRRINEACDCCRLISSFIEADDPDHFND